MSLADWERNGWLGAHRTTAAEIRDLLAVVDRDLADSAAEGLSADWRLNKKRNIAGYERVGLVSDADAEAMRKLAMRLQKDVTAWLRKHHASLLGPRQS
jgi:hypothetical protein